MSDTLTEVRKSNAEKTALLRSVSKITSLSPPEKRHAAVRKLHASGLFNYAEIARALGYANGGVVRNLIHPPNRDRKVAPLTAAQLKRVRTMERDFGRSITAIATAARRAT